MSSTPNHSLALATQAIINLINSRPVSPRHDEIAAIIERMVVARPPPEPSAMSKCRELDEEYGPDISGVRG
jgi:hypothetical protein